MIIAQRPFFIGVDPGDRWVGVAILFQQRANEYFGAAAVYDRQQKPYAVVDDIVHCFHSQKLVHVVVERFQIRQSGFNSYDAGATLQLIGAIDYEADKHHQPVYFVPAASPDDIKLTPLSIPIMNWRKSWGKGPWQHAISAWRCVGHHLLTTNPKALKQLSLATAVVQKVECAQATFCAPGRVWLLP